MSALLRPFRFFGPAAGACTAATLTLLAGGCVPFGGWLYDDPTFVLSEMTIRSGGPGDTLEMVLTACNRNDFPVQANHFSVSLEMGGNSVGTTASDQVIMLQTRDSTKMTVPIPFRRQAGSSAPRHFILRGQTVLQTPIGERRVVLFQRGQVLLMPVNEVAHIPQAGKPCRPGRSTLPGYMPTPIVVAPPPMPIPTGQPQ